MDHIALRMPALVLHVAVDLDKLFENGAVTTRTLGGKASRVMKMTIYITLMFVI